MAETAKTGALNIFADRFESGATSTWTRVASGLAGGGLVQSANPGGGAYAARLPVSNPCAEGDYDGAAAQSLADCVSLAGGLDNGDGEISAVEWGAKGIAGENLGSLDMDEFDSSGSF